MKKYFYTLLLLTPFLSKAQNLETYGGNNVGWTVNLNAGPTIFLGDVKQYDYWPVSTYNNEWRGAGGVIIGKQLLPFLDLRAQLLCGKLAGTKRTYDGGSPANMYFKANFIDYNANLKLDFLSLFKGDSFRRVSVYGYAGIGIVDFRTKRYNLLTDVLEKSYGYDANNEKTKATSETVFPVGIGVEYNFTEKISMVIDYSKRFVNSDKLDALKSEKNDMYDYISLGLTYHFRGPKDSDKDGVPDKMDKCPGTPAGVAVNEDGCPKDKDYDGVADYLDKCPDVVGLAQFAGCPDTDTDGIQDSEDKCPKVKGIAQFAGCPDTDGDGVEDSKDSCATEKGLAQFAGCPDTDGDGIPDKRDRCPLVKGIASLKGCVDTDGDGIADPDDKCPSVAGLIANNGCPAVKKEVLKIFEKALTGIQFETGKDVIKKTSFPILDQVVKAMIENQSYNLEINGHTDNTGVAEKNMVLSQKRADAVKKYLSGKGVAEGRMKSTGFGSTMPIADNKTEAGKSKNRRVEFKVIFQSIELEEVK